MPQQRVCFLVFLDYVNFLDFSRCPLPPNAPARARATADPRPCIRDMASDPQSRHHLLRRLTEKFDVRLIAEAAVAFLARHLPQDAQGFQPGHQRVSGRVSRGDQLFDRVHAHDRPVEQAFQHPVAVGGGAAQVVGDQGAVLLPHRQDAAGREAGFLAHLGHAPQKEGQPSFPVALLAHRLQVLVVGLAVLLEVMGEVEHRLLQDALLGEQEGDQQPPHPPVAIQKGMDGFELGMGQADANQGRQIVLGMEKLLQSAQRLWQLLRGWRHKRGRGQAAAAGTDPVLAAAQLTRSQPSATSAASLRWTKPLRGRLGRTSCSGKRNRIEPASEVVQAVLQ